MSSGTRKTQRSRKEECLAEPAAKRGKKAITPLPCDEARFDQLGHWRQPTNGTLQEHFAANAKSVSASGKEKTVLRTSNGNRHINISNK